MSHHSNISALSLNSSKIILLFILASIIRINGSAQVFKESGINIGVKAGGAKLISEYANHKSIREFTNNPGIATGIEISKVLLSKIELGVEFSYAYLNGETDQTDHFSAIGNHPAFMNPLTGSTEYTNNLIGNSIFFRYYLSEVLRKSTLNPFVKIGFGFLNYKSTFKYIGGEEIIFGKGDENQPDLSTGVLSLGTGFKTSLSKQVYLLTSLDFNLVKYDFLDAVHNYDAEGNRISNITGLYSEIKIGIFYNSNKSNGSTSTSGKKRKKGKGSGGSGNLPFAR